MSEMQPPVPPQPSRHPPPHLYAAPPVAAQPTPTPWAGPPRVQSTRGLATAALLAAGAMLLLTAVTAVASFDAAQSYEEAARRGGSAFDTVTLYDLLGLPLVVAQLVAWVLTAVWLGQARRNLSNIRPGYRFRRSPVWDWLSWVVPIVNLWFPFQIVRDLSRGSSPSFAQHRALGLWWGLWLVGMVLGQSSARLTLDSGSGTTTFDLLPILDCLTTVALGGALVLWIRIVRSTVRDQEIAAGAITNS